MTITEMARSLEQLQPYVSAQTYTLLEQRLAAARQPAVTPSASPVPAALLVKRPGLPPRPLSSHYFKLQ